MVSSIRTAFILIAASRARATRRYAYATLLAGSEAYLPGAETLVCSLAAAARRAERAHAAWAAVGAPDFLALTTPEVDAAAVEARLGAARAASGFEGALVVRPVALIAGPTFDGSERFRHTYAKLHVFNQTAYVRRADSQRTGRGDAAAATWIFRGARRDRDRDAESLSYARRAER